jgi:hypothetical protein
MHTELVADTIELELLAEDPNARSEAWVRSSSHASSLVGPQQVDGAIAVMNRRADLLRSQYPFDVKGVGLVRRPNASDMPYVSLLLATPGSPLLTWDDKRTAQTAEAFENMVVPAVRCMLGGNAESLRFAFPSGGRPPEFPGAILWLARKMGLRPGNGYRPPRRKDGGVDIVAWRPFPDGRPGFPIALVQATIEQRFVHKASDVDLRIWAGWLRLDVDPMSILAIPRTVPNDESWNEASTRAVVLERIRLTSLLPDGFAEPERSIIRVFTARRLADVYERLNL